jgi:YHS domain-containing protein
MSEPTANRVLQGLFCHWGMEKTGEARKTTERGKTYLFSKQHNITSKNTAPLTTMNAGYFTKQNE